MALVSALVPGLFLGYILAREEVAVGSSLALEWVNHASFVLRQGSTSLLCDPWIEGTAFKDGWELVSPTRFSYGDFRGVDYIWFSHQHPDHFAPANLRKIDPTDRRRITVLYQQTTDRLVVNWCKSAGFGKVIELPPREWFQLNDELSVMCGAVNDDSWLAIATPTRKLLNVNDCVLRHESLIRAIAEVVGSIDVLFTQFSYAQWTGNPPELDRRRRDALEKYKRIELQVRILKPDIVVPFASFVYFCHEENFFLNDGMNRVGDVARFIENDLRKRAVVLYPGDKWDLQSTNNFEENARRYDEDLSARLAGGPAYRMRFVSETDLLDCVNRFVSRLKKKNPRARRLIKEHAVVFVTDFQKGYDLSINGISPSPTAEADADLVTSAENIIYSIRTPWGGNTMHVSGRFVSWKNQHEHFFALMRKFHHYNVTPVNLAWVAALARRLVRGFARRATSLRPRFTRRAAAKVE